MPVASCRRAVQGQDSCYEQLRNVKGTADLVVLLELLLHRIERLSIGCRHLLLRIFVVNRNLSDTCSHLDHHCTLPLISGS